MEDYVECVGPIGTFGYFNWEKIKGITIGKIYKVRNVLPTNSAIMITDDKGQGTWYNREFFTSNLGFKGIIKLINQNQGK